MENIKCPNCGSEIPIEDALFSKAEEKAKKEYEKKINEKSIYFKSLQESLDKDRKALEEKQKEQEDSFDKRLTDRIFEESVKLKKEATEKVEEEIRLLKEENEKRKIENVELKQREITILKKEKELKDLQETIEIDIQKTLLEKQDEIEQNIKTKEKERYELKLREYDKKLEDQKQLIEEMKRKAEQGSMQMQGEVQELALEEILRDLFPFDDIQPVPKGVTGADITHDVKNEFQQKCGQIIYESKRTKAFSDGWIDKLKADMLNTHASLAVIVTEVLPKDMNRFGRKDGVWICSFHEVQSVAFTLREMLLREHSVLTSISNMGNKMEILYQYLTSESFKQRVEGIVDGFISIGNQIEHEKRAMQKIWKEREKQLQKVINNTVDMYGSIRGIAGNAIGEVKALELPEYISDDEEETPA